VTGYDLVERVDKRRGVQRSEDALQRAGQSDLGEHRNAAAGIARNRRSVAQDEPPALASRFLGYACEQVPGLVIGEGQQPQLLVSVERGDDTRRPPAELSGTRVEQNRPRKRRDRHVVGTRVSSHRPSLSRQGVPRFVGRSQPLARRDVPVAHRAGAA
jgi:hypothetical protein